jgi:plastocyanin
VQVGGFVNPPVWGELMAYYPQSTSVHVGDSVQFIDKGGFHSVTFLPTGMPMTPLFPRIGATYATELDAAGNPFWFSNSGVNEYQADPSLFLPSGTNTVDGSTLVNSGLGFKKFTVTFTKVGTFNFMCAYHQHMHGVVHVLPASHAIRPGQQIRAQKREARDAAAATAAYQHGAAVPSSSDTVLVAPGNRRAVSLQFYPSQVTAKVGETVHFVWQGNDELHSVTFGPDSYINQQGDNILGPDLVANPIAAFPSEPPGTTSPIDVTPTSHGNGFVNSGLIGDSGTVAGYFGSTPPAQGNSFSVRFTQPGVYHFECLIHVGLMEGDVTVTP